MSLYAEHPGRRTRQVAGDVLVLLWVAVWVLLGVAVHDQVARLAEPGRTLEQAGTSLEDGLRTAGDRVAEVPLLGEELQAPFDAAGGAAARVTEAGVAVQTGVERTAVLAGVGVAFWPVLAAGGWVALRWRFARRLATARRLLDGGAGTDLFALRALARQPLDRLARVGDDPAAAWRRGDETVVRALAELELREVGLRTPG